MFLSHTDYLTEESSLPVDTWKSGEKGKKESTYDAMRAFPEDTLQKSKRYSCFYCPEIYL